jgi:menaquinone-dependent protoporphyrinogen IX oxidase
MKGVIIYKSKYGSTRQYARWLSDELKLPARQPHEISSDFFANCDFIIIGSGVYIGKLLIKNWLRKHVDI